jgi:hypothetical protein
MIEGRRRSQPRGHIPADLVEAAPAGADGMDGAEGDTAASGCQGGCRRDEVTAGPRTLDADLDPEAAVVNLRLHF